MANFDKVKENIDKVKKITGKEEVPSDITPNTTQDEPK